MNDEPVDPILSHLQARKTELERTAHDIMARLSEVETLLASLSDGRTRVRRRLREVPTPETPPEQVA